MYGESNIETHITMCKIDSQWEFAACFRKIQQGLCNNLEGWHGEDDQGKMGRNWSHSFVGTASLLCRTPQGGRWKEGPWRRRASTRLGDGVDCYDPPPGDLGDLTQGSNPGLPHCRPILYCQSHPGSNPQLMGELPEPSPALLGFDPSF